jgi:ABC-type dipeptide/oligopeptide/nickel transport system permease component
LIWRLFNGYWPQKKSPAAQASGGPAACAAASAGSVPAEREHWDFNDSEPSQAANFFYQCVPSWGSNLYNGPNVFDKIFIIFPSTEFIFSS